LKFQEIEGALSNLKTCPKCNSKEGFWFGTKKDYVHVQCKCCGACFDLFEVYSFGEKQEKPKKLRFFRT